jgi:hypothetical protein
VQTDLACASHMSYAFDILASEAQRAIDLLEESGSSPTSAANKGQIEVLSIATEESIRAVAEAPPVYM